MKEEQEMMVKLKYIKLAILQHLKPSIFGKNPHFKTKLLIAYPKE